MTETPPGTRTTFELTPETLRAYLAEEGLVRDARRLRIRPLGGGVSNVVLLIEGQEARWVAKQALEKLRVQEDWRSDRGRVFREAEAIRRLEPKLGKGRLPKIVHVAAAQGFFIMAAAPADAEVWKASLLEGRVEMAVAREAGLLLSRMIRISRADPNFKKRFEDRTVFEQLRVDPYYRTTALRHPDVSEALSELIEASWRVREALVHADYSPKNMLVQEGQIFLIDFECVHWGDPAFDAGFLLNHLVLKAFHEPRWMGDYLAAARQFWATLASELRALNLPSLELRTLRHLGGLMLARIDGKSPVEYLRDDSTRNRVRRAAKRILNERPETLEEALGILRREIA